MQKKSTRTVRTHPHRAWYSWMTRQPSACCYATVLTSGVLAASHIMAQHSRNGALAASHRMVVRSSHIGSERFIEMLPHDLDELGSPEVVKALGVQLLLFAGWHPSATGWKQNAPPPSSLSKRVDLVAPTWKPRGNIDYSWPSSLDNPTVGADGSVSLFAAAASATLGLPGAGSTVASLASALEGIGLDASTDYDDEARHALVEMLTWRLPLVSQTVRLQSGAEAEEVTLLVLSFDATPQCRSVSDCPKPGPANELLAATADAFVRRRAADHSQRVHVVAQWEVAAAMRALDSSTRCRVTAVGTPGQFENTAEIFDQMLRAMGPSACPEVNTDTRNAAAFASPANASATSRIVLLSHPDHLRRALRIGETAFARAVASEGCAQAARLVPAMQPYRLDWPMVVPATTLDKAGLNLFAGVTARVQTHGQLKTATWYDDANGFFPDGEPQRWAHRREIWISYEFWARAKGVATGIMIAPSSANE